MVIQRCRNKFYFFTVVCCTSPSCSCQSCRPVFQQKAMMCCIRPGMSFCCSQLPETPPALLSWTYRLIDGCCAGCPMQCKMHACARSQCDDCCLLRQVARGWNNSCLPRRDLISIKFSKLFSAPTITGEGAGGGCWGRVCPRSSSVYSGAA